MDQERSARLENRPRLRQSKFLSRPSQGFPARTNKRQRRRLPKCPFLDSVGPLVVLQSKDSDIVKIFTGSEIVVSSRHDGLRISFRVIGRATKRILKAVHA
jgi:hypothetical protein